MEGKVLNLPAGRNETNMNKINGSDRIKVSADNSDTTHTRDHYKPF